MSDVEYEILGAWYEGDYYSWDELAETDIEMYEYDGVVVEMYGPNGEDIVVTLYGCDEDLIDDLIAESFEFYE